MRKSSKAAATSIARRRQRIAEHEAQVSEPADASNLDNASTDNDDDDDVDGEVVSSEVESLEVLREQELEADVANDTENALRSVVGREIAGSDRAVAARRSFEAVCASCFLIVRADTLEDDLCNDCR